MGPADLLDMLKGRGQRDPEITKTLIRSKLEDKDQDEIATTSCKVSTEITKTLIRSKLEDKGSRCKNYV